MDEQHQSIEAHILPPRVKLNNSACSGSETLRRTSIVGSFRL
jgi:hypothetical protein